VIKKGKEKPAQLKKFKADGYRYCADMSSPAVPVSIRDDMPGSA